MFSYLKEIVLFCREVAQLWSEGNQNEDRKEEKKKIAAKAGLKYPPARFVY